MKRSILTLLAALTALTAVVAPTAAAKPAPTAGPVKASETDLKINLVTQVKTFAGKGSAKYRDRKGEREFQVEIEAARRFAGAKLLITVNDMIVGDVTLDAFGKGRLSLNNRLGNDVPVVAAGAVVKAIDAGGVTVLSGTF